MKVGQKVLLTDYGWMPIVKRIRDIKTIHGKTGEFKGIFLEGETGYREETELWTKEQIDAMFKQME